MNEFTTIARINEGRLTVNYPDMLKQWVAAQAEGKEFVLAISPYKKNRSKDQNAYYWSCLQIVANDIGYTKEELHEVLKIRFLGTDTLKIGTDTYTIPKSSANLTTAEFKEYMAQVHHLAATMGIYLPDPSEHYAKSR